MSLVIMKASHGDEIKQAVDNPMQKQQQFNHFSHRHPLELSQQKDDTNAVCSGCHHEISGPAYVCTKPKCGFLLHDLCFDLPRRLRHGSHPNHPLFLLHSPPYTDKESTCNACGDLVHAFTYHCETCGFDLHVECASLPEFEIRRDHMHPLVLLWDAPDKAAGADESVCYVCDETVEKGCWMYSCLACNCGAHLECTAADP
ncbi:hypothetical protein PHJA_002913400 [Phtheirospermum japonicum]|uniref:DC1 domain-containing protein n=1 Tax=Phtheirospermum japonicum TaxID=374723 RepID=A0A830DAC5_9LAMI|nr:hypothetical protein PHJA_002913400 [Phtheirospermum japonicum]